MAIIPAKKPYEITHFGQTLEIDLYIYDFDATPPTIGVDDPNYTVKKVSFADGVDENLAIDISPYIRDFFSHFPHQTVSNSGEDLFANEYLKVDAVVNTVEENHTALDGYADATGTSKGALQYTRAVNENTSGHLTVNTGTNTSVRYHRSDGTFQAYSVSPTTEYFSMPLVPTTFSLNESKTLNIEFIGSKSVFYYCDVINCDFDQDNTLEVFFVNKHGLWETVKVAGNFREAVNTSSDTFVRASNDNTQRYNTNGYRNYTVNTGWLREDSKEMVQSLLMSDDVRLLHNTDFLPVEVTSTSKQYKTRKTDKMINYTFQLKVGIDIISYES